ncbi:MAG: Fic family protein [Fibromonadaceae bacterium]|jgi:Fic family protein|nr:Fic family protein [Fibromonadaceae bacterium]
MQIDLEEIWQEIESKNEQFASSHSQQNLGYEKFAIYSIITHSTAIEGSTLTEQETELLFESGLTAKGKPLLHHLMNTDLKNAYMFAVEQAKEKPLFSPAFLKTLNALIMKGTGGTNSTLGGNFDSSKGDFRLCGVMVGIGGKSYMNYLKIPEKADELCKDLNEKLNAKPQNLRELCETAFNAHLHLATIHPWADGNGRTARLLMNFLQFYFKIVPTKIFLEDRAEYIASLRKSQDENENSHFLKFMALQHLKTLEEHIIYAFSSNIS